MIHFYECMKTRLERLIQRLFCVKQIRGNILSLVSLVLSRMEQHNSMMPIHSYRQNTIECCAMMGSETYTFPGMLLIVQSCYVIGIEP